MPDWDDLRIFLAVARARKLALAAQLLELDATTVSRRVARLEQALDTRLFETNREGRALTAEGQHLLVAAEAMESALAAGAADVTGERARLAGVIRISLSEGFGTWLVASQLASFHRQHPAIEIELAVSSGFLNPSKREADVAIMLARPPRGPLVSRKLTDYALGLYAARDYVENRGQPDSVAALESHPLVGYIDELIYAPQLDYLRELGPTIRASVRSSSINAQHHLIATGAGIGLLPLFIGRQDDKLVRILPKDVRLTRSFWLVVHRDVRHLARVEALIDWLGAMLREQRPLLLEDPA